MKPQKLSHSIILSILISAKQLQCQFQPTSFPQLPCDVNYNSSQYPDFLRVKAEDLASNELNITGVFRRTSSYNGFPVYRKDFLYLDGAHTMQFPGETRSKGVLRQSGWNIFVSNSGHWSLQEDGFNLGYENTDQICTNLLATSGLWRYSSVTGFTMQIRLNIRENPRQIFPDFYHVDFAPIQINGFYAKTSTFSSDAPIYRKPGVGNMQNFLFLYKGSWMVAKDPLSNSLTYRMFQQSQGSLSPDASKPWNVVSNDGTIEEQSQVIVYQLQQTFPPSYTLTSSGPVRNLLPKVLGYYRLTNITRNNIPVYQHQQIGYYLYQNDAGSWVVSNSLVTPIDRETLSQDSKGSPLPLADVDWRYYSNGWNTDDSLTAIGEATPETRAAQLRLGLTIGFPVIAAILLVIIILSICCCLRRRKTKRFDEKPQSATLKKVSKL